MVGLTRHLVIGKHSGSHGLLARLQQLGLDHAAGNLDGLLEWVRCKAQLAKRPLSDLELRVLYHDWQKVA